MRERLTSAVGRVRHAGRAVQCPICGRRSASFLSTGGLAGLACRGCGSRPRQRVLWMYLRARGLPAVGHRVLHCAPEPFLEHALRAIVDDGYVSVDLEDPVAMVVADLTALPFEDASFDLVLCSHVLEHVPDDRAAMAEMARVLARGGEAIVQSPVNHDQTWGTYEDPSLTDPEERLTRFSQADHVRVYGPDLSDRLEEVGFLVSVERPAEAVDEQTVARLGLMPRVGPLRNELYRCVKPDGR